MNNQVYVAEQVGRAFTIEAERGGFASLVRAWTLDDPATEVARHVVRHQGIAPDTIDHLAVLDETVWLVTSLGFVDRFTLSLTPIDSQRVRWRAEGGAHSQDGRRMLVAERGAYAIRDLIQQAEWTLGDDPSDYDEESWAAALDFRGEILVRTGYGRYSGLSVFVRRKIGEPPPAEDLLVLEGEVTQLSVAPGGRHVACVLPGEQTVVFPWPQGTHPEESIDKLHGTWRATSPGTLLADFLDEERIVLVGRERAFVRAVEDGALLSEAGVRGTPIAVDAIRAGLWARTETGFLRFSLGG